MPGKSSQQEDAPDLEHIAAWLAALSRAVEESEGKLAVEGAYPEEAATFVKLSHNLQSCAYVLRPQDALRAVKLMARSVVLLQSYELATATRKYDAAASRMGTVIEDALVSVRTSIEGILAAVATRITAGEAPDLAEAMLAMAETRAGRQEFLDAMLGHMLWLLAAKPRTFQPQVVAQLLWALGRLALERGADGEALSALGSDANRRAVAALEARLVEVLDDFLDEDVGALAQDPTGGALLSDDALRRVLHRAGRLQVGLVPGSVRFLEGARRLEAAARERLWEPYQAEIMPFMRDYCERLAAATPAAAPPPVPPVAERAGGRG